MALITKIFDTPGAFSWTAPATLAGSAIVECWGSGGRGLSIHSGGGGAYARKMLTLTPGATYSGQVGNSEGTATTKPSWFQTSSTVFADYGQEGDGSGGSTANSIGDVKFAGGDGGVLNASASTILLGGGGGGGAGDADDGFNGQDGVAGGLGGLGGTNGGGSGGNGVIIDTETLVEIRPASNGTSPGGGGGGTASGTVAGGNGLIKITYEDATGVVEFNTPGAFTWTAPANITGTAVIECWGSGGVGRENGFSYDGHSGGGGGGGAYAKKTLTLTPGTTYNGQIGISEYSGIAGAKPSWFQSVSTVFADFGRNGTSANGGVGGSVANSIGDVKFAGGIGGNGITEGGGAAILGGGGGGGAGDTANGIDGQNATSGGVGGIGGANGGGKGGDGRIGTSALNPGRAAGIGQPYGGGGGGGREPNGSGGTLGSHGLVRITYNTTPVPAINANITRRETPHTYIHQEGYGRLVGAITSQTINLIDTVIPKERWRVGSRASAKILCLFIHNAGVLPQLSIDGNIDGTTFNIISGQAVSAPLLVRRPFTLLIEMAQTAPDELGPSRPIWIYLRQSTANNTFASSVVPDLIVKEIAAPAYPPTSDIIFRITATLGGSVANGAEIIRSDAELTLI